MVKITIDLHPNRIEIHEGRLNGARLCEYRHSDVTIYKRGAMGKSGIGRAAISHVLLCWLRDNHFPVRNLVDIGGSDRRFSSTIAKWYEGKE